MFTAAGTRASRSASLTRSSNASRTLDSCTPSGAAMPEEFLELEDCAEATVGSARAAAATVAAAPAPMRPRNDRRLIRLVDWAGGSVEDSGLALSSVMNLSLFGKRRQARYRHAK